MLRQVQGLVKQGAYVLINHGAHPLSGGKLSDILQGFDVWLDELLTFTSTQPAEFRYQRLAWLGTYPPPVAGFEQLLRFEQ